ncbi:MAG: hypothetical protein ACRDTC_04530 [Pseudonocardiaceae bacterium]
MVAYEPHASPSPWIWTPTSRALGAVFAGSAMMFGAAVLQGGSLLSPGEVQPAAEPVAGRTDTAPAPISSKFPGTGTISAAPIVAPSQAAPWTPGATPDWGGPLRDLPVQRAPVRPAPQQNVPPPASPPEDTREDPATSRDGSAQPADSPDRGTLGDVLDYIGP